MPAVIRDKTQPKFNAVSAESSALAALGFILILKNTVFLCLLPIYNFKPVVYIIAAQIIMFKIIGVFPDIDGNNRAKV